MTTTSLKAGGAHGNDLRGLQEAANATTPNRIDRHDFDGRFNRMFDKLPPAVFSLNDIDSLAMSMVAEDETPQTPETETDSEENVGTAADPGIPAGYTYFGQFVDHDLTLDAVSLSMKQEDVSGVENFRTPALDLDSVYARGPDDQPYMYDPSGRELLLGNRDLKSGAAGVALTKDLLRVQGRAVIGDKRNDENVIVSQLQGLFIHFHNKLAEEFAGATFDEVRQQVRWTYQWLVLWDYLPRIVGRDLVDQILPPGSAHPNLKYFAPKTTAYIPIEFTGAAYRFGHSMIRPIYRLNQADNIGGPAGDSGRRLVFAPQDTNSGLNGFQEFDAGLGVDWTLFFETGNKTLASEIGKDKHRIQPAYKIDPSLVFPTSKLPEFSNPDGTPKNDGGVAAINILAQRNLRRGMMLGLPSGQAVARHLKIPVIPDDELILAKAQSDDFDPPAGGKQESIADGRPTMRDSAPLWFYVLAEARHEWHKKVAKLLAQPENATATGDARKKIIDSVPTRLGLVGGRIVAETLIGLVAADSRSLLNEGLLKGFRPPIGDEKKSGYARLTMGDLVTFVQG